MADLRAQWGALHLLINNAGVCYYGKTREMTLAQWNRIMDINLQAPFRLIYSLLPMLGQQDSAHIANICSMYGLVTYRKQAAYQASKFALVRLTRSLRAEYAGTGLGLSANRGLEVITPLARWQWRSQRLMPGLVDRIKQIGFGFKALRREKAPQPNEKVRNI